MPTTRQQKEDTLKELNDKFAKAKSVAFGQYSGMTVVQLSGMRRKERDAGVEFKVAKKTIFKLAAMKQSRELTDDIIAGTVGAAFS